MQPFAGVPRITSYNVCYTKLLRAEAAHRQGKFWEMHDLIFENQREMSPAQYSYNFV